MASTNKTTNYDLSQYIGTDKPTYLSDYNGDMYKIDAQMKQNADDIATATSAISSATSTATTALSTAQSAESTANSASSTATSASTTAGNAQSTANSALSTATSAQSTANQVASDLSTLSGTVSGIASDVSDIQTNMQEILLFEDVNGSTGTNITLSESSANFEKLEIVVGNWQYRETIEIRPKKLASGGLFPIYYIWQDNYTSLGIFSAWYTLSGTTLTYSGALRWFQYANQSPAVDNTNQLSIYEIYGYKY